MVGVQISSSDSGVESGCESDGLHDEDNIVSSEKTISSPKEKVLLRLPLSASSSSSSSDSLPMNENIPDLVSEATSLKGKRMKKKK